MTMTKIHRSAVTASTAPSSIPAITAASPVREPMEQVIDFTTRPPSSGTTGRTRLLTDLPGKPLGLVSDPSGHYLLLRYSIGTAQSRHGRGSAVRLVRLDTTTGKITSLAAHANGTDQFVGEAVLAW